MLRVKICGVTNLEDALHCASAGADALGFIFAESQRKANPETVRQIIEKLPPWIATVGVFENAPLEAIARLKAYCRFTWVQLHGNEPEELAGSFHPFVIKTVFRPEQIRDDYPCAAFLVDRPKGDQEFLNELFFQKIARLRTEKPLILAGGLTVENIEHALSQGEWYGVDVARGVETFPGKKDPARVSRFIEKVKGYRK